LFEIISKLPFIQFIYLSLSRSSIDIKDDLLLYTPPSGPYHAFQVHHLSNLTHRYLKNFLKLNIKGITERAVRNIIADLEEGGYIEKTREGRRVKYKIHPELSLRHPTQKDQFIKNLLKAMGCKLKFD